MTALVCKLKDTFLDKMNDLFNEQYYFIKSCGKFDSDTLEQDLSDLSLRIWFEENNKIVLAGKLMKYCDKDGHKRKIKIKDISQDLNQPEVNIIHNHLVDDNWNKIDW